MINYRVGNLFDALPGTLLAHACNCKGRWGSGIAQQFAIRFPSAKSQYEEECSEKGDSLLGDAALFYDRGHVIGCLFTSKGYGQSVDPPPVILEATERAVHRLVIYAEMLGLEIHMPKINSGLFNVPWEETESILNRYPRTTFTVWSPN